MPPPSCGGFLNHFQHKKILMEKGCVILKFVGTSCGLGLNAYLTNLQNEFLCYNEFILDLQCKPISNYYKI